MTSILNNIAASTALLNLQNTVQSLRDTQQQISTGLKIGSAADNAAYFAISTVLKSDSNALSTVSDTLSLGGSSLDVATNALDKIQTTLSDIKAQLLAATTPGIDRVKIQAQIAQDQAQLKNISDSANFNGQNVLSVNSASATYNPSQEFVSSYSRDPSGAVTVGMISVDLTKTTLFDSNGNIGILDKVDTSTVGSYQPAQTGAAAVTSNAAGTGASIFNLDIHTLTDTPADQATLNAYQKQVDAAISTVTAAASEIGTARARITQQQSFVSSLQTSIDNGVGSLVDADLNTASTNSRLSRFSSSLACNRCRLQTSRHRWS